MSFKYHTMTLNELLGKEVLNIHRQSCDHSQAYRDSNKGIVVDVDRDRLPLIGVDCGDDFTRWLPLQDITLTGDHPHAWLNTRLDITDL